MTRSTRQRRLGKGGRANRMTAAVPVDIPDNPGGYDARLFASRSRISRRPVSSNPAPR